MLAALPPSSRVSALVRAGDAREDLPPDLGRAGERDLVDARMGDERHPDLAGPRDDVDDAGRQVGLAADVGEEEGADSGVVDAGFRTTVLPAARAGAIFQASISSGKFHGMIWAATPSGLRDAARERVLELVRPAGVVPEVGRGERDVDVARLLDRLAGVHRFEDGELARPLLEDPGDPEEVLRPLLAAQGAPRPALNAVRAARTAVSMSAAVAFATCGERLLGRGVDRRERLAVRSRRRPCR